MEEFSNKEGMDNKRPHFHYREMPKQFYSYASGEPFTHCISCNMDLLSSGTHYVIEKAIRKYKGYTAEDVVFEYAMCLSCAEKMRQELSKESLERINRYFEQHVDLEKRRKELLENKEFNPDSWTSKCLITGESVNDVEEYQIFAHCSGNGLMYSFMPYMISNKASDEIAVLLSDKTLDELDGFIDNHFGLPPGFKEPIKGRDLIFV